MISLCGVSQPARAVPFSLRWFRVVLLSARLLHEFIMHLISDRKKMRFNSCVISLPLAAVAAVRSELNQQRKTTVAKEVRFFSSTMTRYFWFLFFKRKIRISLATTNTFDSIICFIFSLFRWMSTKFVRLNTSLSSNFR